MDGSKAPPATLGARLRPGSGVAGGRLALFGAAFAGGGLAAWAFAGRPDGLLLTVAAAFAGLGVCEAAVLLRRVLVPADAPEAADGADAAFAVTDDPLAVVEDGIRLVRTNAAYDRLFADVVPQQALDLMPGGRAAVAQLLAAIAAGRPGTAQLAIPADAGELSVAVLSLEMPRRVLWHLRRHEAVRPAVPARADSPSLPAVAPAEASPAPEAMLRFSRERLLQADESVCALLGYPPGYFADGCPLDEVVRPSHLARLKVVLAAARAPQTLAIDLVGRDGAIVPVQLRIAVEAPDEAVAAVLPKPAAAAGAGEVGLFFQRAPLALARVDAQGAIRSANGAFDLLFGRADGQGGRMLPALVAERDRADLEAMLAQATAPGAAPGAVFCDVGLPGPGARSARLYGARLAEGGASGDIALCAVDTTAQKALEAQFTQSQKMEAVGHLAGGVAHDFNNLLTAIIGFCDLLIARHRPSDPSFPDMMQIKQNANRAADLVGQLLAFSRRQTLRPNVTQLTDVISDVSAMLRRLIGERITLDVQHGRGLWPVKVDANKFEQVIVNLAVNARDAMPEGGTLTVRTMNVPAKASAGYRLPEADHVLVEVEDTGTGIPPELVDKIFEPFFTTKEVGKGTGLGLSTVYGIVQQTGGTLQVASEPGRGAIFRVFLPRHVGESTEAVAAPVVDDKAHDLTGHGRVLLVEDEDAVRAFAARALSARGYEVILAASGVEALAAMDRLGGSVDLVVSDVVMPEMDGPTLLRELRARDPGLKFIFMSGYAEEAFARNLPQSESFSFLPKPFSLKDLVGTVATALKG